MPSQKIKMALTKFDANKTYSISEAIKIAKSLKCEKFDASLEVHMNLGIDPKKGEQQVRASITLPHGIGKTKKIAAFVTPDKVKEAQDAGAELVGGEELIDAIVKSGKTDFDIAVAVPDMMKNMAKAAKILGPRGLMPSPKNETVTLNVTKAINELKKGKLNFKNDDTSNVHQVFGKLSFTDDQLVENFNALIETIKKAKPNSSKGTFIKSLTVCSTMGPAIKVSA